MFQTKNHKARPSSDAVPAYLRTKLVELCHALIEDIVLHLLAYQDTIAVDLILKRLHLRKMDKVNKVCGEEEPRNRLCYKLCPAQTHLAVRVRQALQKLLRRAEENIHRNVWRVLCHNRGLGLIDELRLAEGRDKRQHSLHGARRAAVRRRNHCKAM